MADTGRSTAAAGGGVAYFLAFIGAAVFYIQQADGFWDGVLGFFKACVWPAFFVYDVLQYISA